MDPIREEVVRFAGPSVRMVSTSAKVCVDQLWADLVWDRWFARTVVTAPAPGGNGRLIRVVRYPRRTIENPRDLYWFLASRKLHSIDPVVDVRHLPVTPGSVVHLDRGTSARQLQNFVLLVEEETVSLVSLEGPLPRMLQVTATTLHGVRVATLTFCPLQRGFFDTARCNSLYGTLVIQISDAVCKSDSSNFARAFAPLTFDPN